MSDYEKEYEEFWKDIVENEDGTLNKDQVMRELSDFSKLIENVPKVYEQVTGGMISKPMTDVSVVLDFFQEYVDEETEYAFEDGKEAGYHEGYDAGYNSV